MPFFVYILQSDADSCLYVGHTGNLEDRIKRHNQGRSVYTRSKRPWRVIYQESFENRADAVRREAYLKSLHRKDLLLALSSHR